MRQPSLFASTRCPSCGSPAQLGPCVRSGEACSHAIVCERDGCAGGTESFNLLHGAAAHEKARAA